MIKLNNFRLGDNTNDFGPRRPVNTFRIEEVQVDDDRWHSLSIFQVTLWEFFFAILPFLISVLGKREARIGLHVGAEDPQPALVRVRGHPQEFWRLYRRSASREYFSRAFDLWDQICLIPPISLCVSLQIPLHPRCFRPLACAAPSLPSSPHLLSNSTRPVHSVSHLAFSLLGAHDLSVKKQTQRIYQKMERKGKLTNGGGGQPKQSTKQSKTKYMQRKK